MNTKTNCVGTAEFYPSLHKTKDNLRSLCGVKVIRLSKEKQAEYDKCKTLGDVVNRVGYETCVECNSIDANTK